MIQYVLYVLCIFVPYIIGEYNNVCITYIFINVYIYIYTYIYIYNYQYTYTFLFYT